MEDRQIVELYWRRSEAAIPETEMKYGGYCRAIAMHILASKEDSEECVNDTWLRAWNSMPPARPDRLRAFLGRITRNLSLDRYRLDTSKKRGGGQLELALDELCDCLPDSRSGPDADEFALTQLLDRFLASLSGEARVIFLRRYWYMLSVREISDGMHIGESKVKMSLMRSRERLRALLEKEGFSP